MHIKVLKKIIYWLVLYIHFVIYLLFNTLIMKHLFINLKFSKINNANAIGFYRSIANVVETANPVNLQVDNELLVFKNNIKTFDNVFNGVFSSKFTNELMALDERRDLDLRGIRWAAKSAAINRDAHVVKAGKTVLINIDKYGAKIESKPDKEETTIIRNICDEATKEGDFKDALETLGLLSWIDAMNATNNDFEKKLGERNQDVVSNKSKISPTQAVADARSSYETLLKAIDARNTLDTTGKYTALIDAINNLIKATNTTVKAKVTTAQKAKMKNNGTQ